MHMKRNMAFFLLLSFVMTAALTACNGTTPPENTEAPTEVPTEAPTQSETQGEWDTEAPADVACTLTVKDQDGALIPNVTLHLTAFNGNGPKITVTTDAEGKCTATLTESVCSVSYDELPTGYLLDTTSFEVAKEITEYEILLINNIPNGTEARPFIIHEATTTVTIPASTSHVYLTYGAKDCEFTMTAPGLKVIYKGADYTPDDNGMIRFPFVSEGPRDPAYITFTNTSETDTEITFDIKPVPGSFNNPIIVENENEIITTEVPKDTTVYYKWIVKNSGVLMVMSETPKNNIYMSNLNNSTVSYYTEGNRCEYLAVSEGDEILIAVASLDSSAEINEVQFSLNEYAGTAEDPVPFEKEAACFTQKGEESCVYSYTGPATHVYIRGEFLTVVYGDTVVTPNADGEIRIDIDASSEAFVFTMMNIGGANQEYTVQFLIPSAS